MSDFSKPRDARLRRMNDKSGSFSRCGGRRRGTAVQAAAPLALLFLAGLSAGFIDAIAGGGGLISVPALLWAGLPPQWRWGQ